MWTVSGIANTMGIAVSMGAGVVAAEPADIDEIELAEKTTRCS